MTRSYFIILLTLVFIQCKSPDAAPDLQYMAGTYFSSDSQWYKDNIPFFECSDKEIEQVYYYRWKLYKAHIRNVGPGEYVITEFINHVAWDRDPYCTINAASMHHIYEGRWLKDDRYINGYINYLFQKGGNNRRYSESVADAAYANFLVNADTAFLVRQLDSMMATYEAWYDHYDSSKMLYYIPAMPDATEYTIASIDASGGTAGFDGGDAFRPTINSYMYGNAKAISNVARLKGKADTAYVYSRLAARLKVLVEKNLWNDSMQHFIDRYKQNNQYVHYWDFIRGRELAGFAPWYFNLPDDNKTFNNAWRHITDTSHLLGHYGFRTNEPSYEHYFKQFVWYEGQRGSQWNGPSWPYQSSQALTAMANFLNHYQQAVISPADYVKLLRLYARQHYLSNGYINLVENYDPNLGGAIVYYYWSNHYLHSTFNNLVISGLCGIRPSETDTLMINPLIDDSVSYFCLGDLNYHGHRLTITYDKVGGKYKKGLTVWVDGIKTAVQEKDGKHFVVVGAPVIKEKTIPPANIALNIDKKEYPRPSASTNAVVDTGLYQAIDGRVWYFTEITNFWSTQGSTNTSDWYSLDFGSPREISTVKLYLLEDGKKYFIPKNIRIEIQQADKWTPVQITGQKIAGNTVNSFSFDKIAAQQIRIHFDHGNDQMVALCEIECY
jgi:hypothetical protein